MILDISNTPGQASRSGLHSFIVLCMFLFEYSLIFLLLVFLLGVVYFIFLVWGSYAVVLGFVYFLRENLNLDGEEGKENVEGLGGGKIQSKYI